MKLRVLVHHFIFIIFQVENEYGSYYTCDHNYMKYLQDLFQKHLGDDVILFTVDPIGFKSDINCGTLPSLFTTIDFGPGFISYFFIAFKSSVRISDSSSVRCPYKRNVHA